MRDMVLVAYASRRGATAEIAEAIGARLREAGLGVEVTPVGEVRSLERYAAVVLGSAVYATRWRREALRFLRANRDALAERELWLFSSGPVGVIPNPPNEHYEEVTKPRRVERMAEALQARDHVVFGGRIGTDGGYIQQTMARNTAADPRDQRDWSAIAAWADRIAASLASDHHHLAA